MKATSRIVTTQVVPEGVGAKVARVIGNEIRGLDPFLMLDHFRVKLPAGFPDHPHRGFETVTYMQQGVMCHEDFKGNKGVIEPGDVQWMTAGRGIVHAEMPGSYEEEQIGFQLWINLRSELKMCEPEYQEIKKDKIPTVESDGVRVKLIAGDAFGKSGPIKARTPAYFMDFTVPKGKNFEQEIPSDWNSILYVYSGSCVVGSDKKQVSKGQVVQFNKEKNTKLPISTDQSDCGFILLAGKPLDEPVSQHGPFVMNDKQQLQQTMQDYSYEKNGFEGARKFESKIQHLVDKSQYKSIMEWIRS